MIDAFIWNVFSKHDDVSRRYELLFNSKCFLRSTNARKGGAFLTANRTGYCRNFRAVVVKTYVMNNNSAVAMKQPNGGFSREYVFTAYYTLNILVSYRFRPVKKTHLFQTLGHSAPFPLFL